MAAAPLPGPLPNRPGEPDFQLKLTPDCVVFCCASPKPVWCDATLTNPGTSKETYKVKCTSSEFFRVQPPIGVVGPNENVKIRIWFQNKTIPDAVKQRHYFAIYHMKCAETVNNGNAKDLWTKGIKVEGVRRLPVIFEKSKTQPPETPGADAAAPAAAAPAPAPAAAAAAPEKAAAPAK